MFVASCLVDSTRLGVVCFRRRCAKCHLGFVQDRLCTALAAGVGMHIFSSCIRVQYCVVCVGCYLCNVYIYYCVSLVCRWAGLVW